MNGPEENSIVNSQAGILSNCDKGNSLIPLLDKNGMVTNHCQCSLVIFGKEFFITLATIICIILASTVVITLTYSRQIIHHIKLRKAHKGRIGSAQAQTS